MTELKPGGVVVCPECPNLRMVGFINKIGVSELNKKVLFCNRQNL